MMTMITWLKNIKIKSKGNANDVKDVEDLNLVKSVTTPSLPQRVLLVLAQAHTLCPRHGTFSIQEGLELAGEQSLAKEVKNARSFDALKDAVLKGAKILGHRAIPIDYAKLAEELMKK